MDQQTQQPQEQQQEQQQQQTQQQKEVIVVIEGGWVQEVIHPGDVKVIVRDYDWADADEPSLKVDEDGEKYSEEVWG